MPAPLRLHRLHLFRSVIEVRLAPERGSLHSWCWFLLLPASLDFEGQPEPLKALPSRGSREGDSLMVLFGDDEITILYRRISELRESSLARQ